MPAWAVHWSAVLGVVLGDSRPCKTDFLACPAALGMDPEEPGLSDPRQQGHQPPQLFAKAYLVLGVTQALFHNSSQAAGG